jgi:hypothetical protein
MFLREEQRVLIEQLKRKSTPIADMYYGGLRSLADEENPYRFHLAAHAFRELIAHCAQLTVETVVYGDGMKSRLKPVKEAYQEWKRTSSLGADPTANVVGFSEDLMVALDSFFDWQESNRPEARKKTAMMLTQLSGAGPALPSDVVANEISGWMKADEYFKAVAHNNHKAKQDEFIGKLFLIEDILLRRIQPPPVSDLDEIDALLLEADHAN